MRSQLSLGVLFVSLLLLPACASSGGTGAGSRNADVITADEIRSTSHATAYEVIGALRPQWLRTRAANSIMNTRNAGGGASNEVVVYLDNMRMGNAESLQSVRADVVQQAEMVNAMTATQRWGTGHAAGAILITTTQPR